MRARVRAGHSPVKQAEQGSHAGDWQDCQKCRDGFEAEIYAYYGTNEYNFVKLENPPAFEPKHCSKCGREIALAEGGYSTLRGEYWCEDCGELRLFRRGEE